MNKEPNRKEYYTFVEVFGAEAVLNMALEEEGLPPDDLYVVDGYLNSTGGTNGHPIYFDKDAKFSHAGLLDNGMLVGVCYDDDENKSFWRIEPSNITKIIY